MFGFDPNDFRLEDLDQVAAQAEETMRRLAQAQEELDDITGEGESEDGKVQAFTDASGRLEDVIFKPQAMRMDSETLAESVIEAVQRAQEDGARQSQELLSEAVGENSALFPESLTRERIEEQIAEMNKSFVRMTKPPAGPSNQPTGDPE